MKKSFLLIAVLLASIGIKAQDDVDMALRRAVFEDMKNNQETETQNTSSGSLHVKTLNTSNSPNTSLPSSLEGRAYSGIVLTSKQIFIYI